MKTGWTDPLGRHALVGRHALGALALGVLLVGTVLAAEPSAPPSPTNAPGNAFGDAERRAFVAWVLSRPEVRAQTAGRRTRVLRVWSEAVKGDSGVSRRGTVLLRDYDAGIAREITADLPEGRIQIRVLTGVQPSKEEIEEGMEIVRHDPALERFVENPRFTLIGGFHNRSRHRDDPCALEVCLEFAFMKPNYEGPARYVIVNLSRGAVAHHDFRGGRAGEPPPRMTERAGQ
jgi:hypothetical protein